MRWISPEIALTTYALVNVGLMAVTMAGLVACYFFMSIMFPTIFSLGLRGLGSQTKRGASGLVMAIVGGALAPMLMGAIADRTSMRRGFVVPLICFAVVALYGGCWRKLHASWRS